MEFVFVSYWKTHNKKLDEISGHCVLTPRMPNDLRNLWPHARTHSPLWKRRGTSLPFAPYASPNKAEANSCTLRTNHDYFTQPHMIIFFISIGTVALLCFYYGDVEPLSSTIHYDKQYSFGWDLLNFVQRLCTLKFIGSFNLPSTTAILVKTSL